MNGRDTWVGNAERFGILQRLGIVCSVLSAVLFCLAFGASGDASFKYALLVLAHALLYTGFIVAAVADRAAGRRFSCGRLYYAACTWFVYAVLGPVIMSAAVAASGQRAFLRAAPVGQQFGEFGERRLVASPAFDGSLADRRARLPNARRHHNRVGLADLPTPGIPLQTEEIDHVRQTCRR